MPKPNLFRDLKTSPEFIRMTAILDYWFALSLRNGEDLLYERGIEVSHEAVRFWWNRSGPLYAAEIGRKRGRQNAGLATLALASGRGFRENQRHHELPLAGG
jgi:putative transposase